jgi:hypothetical protein
MNQGSNIQLSTVYTNYALIELPLNWRRAREWSRRGWAYLQKTWQRGMPVAELGGWGSGGRWREHVDAGARAWPTWAHRETSRSDRRPLRERDAGGGAQATGKGRDNLGKARRPPREGPRGPGVDGAQASKP